MVDRTLFATRPQAVAATARNRAGAPAYALDAEATLAQLAGTGSLGDAFHASAEVQLDDALAAADAVSVECLARTAVYARERCHRKDLPALLLAVLSRRDTRVFELVFDRVVDDAVVLRAFVQIMRSGAAGRRSLGTTAKRCVARWLNVASDARLVGSMVGQSPSLADLVRMVHPRPPTVQREAFYAWLIGRPCDVSLLPRAVRDLIAFRAGETSLLPAVPHRLLTNAGLTTDQWCELASTCGWQALRMNLASFARHGVFERDGMAEAVAARLADPDAIRRARVLPYQLLAASRFAGDGVPKLVLRALDEALEVSVSNVPRLDGRIAVCVDVSGSMQSPVTGYRRGATTSVRCVDVAALFAAAVVRGNPSATVLPFDHRVHRFDVAPGERVADVASRLAAYGGGGTDCSAPLREIEASGQRPDLVVMVSDNESWIGRGAGRQTPAMEWWNRLHRRCPDARLACIDIAPYGTVQVAPRDDVLNVGGFTDAVFDTVGRFAHGAWGAACWTDEVRAVDL